MRDNNLTEFMAYAFLDCMRWNREQLTVIFTYVIPKAMEPQVKIGGTITLGDITAGVTKILSDHKTKLLLGHEDELLNKVQWNDTDQRNEMAMLETCKELEESGFKVEKVVDGMTICVQFSSQDFITAANKRTGRLVDEAKRAWFAYTLLKKHNMDEFFTVPEITLHVEPGRLQ